MARIGRSRDASVFSMGKVGVSGGRHGKPVSATFACYWVLAALHFRNQFRREPRLRRRSPGRPSFYTHPGDDDNRHDRTGLLPDERRRAGDQSLLGLIEWQLEPSGNLVLSQHDRLGHIESAAGVVVRVVLLVRRPPRHAAGPGRSRHVPGAARGLSTWAASPRQESVFAFAAARASAATSSSLTASSGERLLPNSTSSLSRAGRSFQ